MDIDRAEVDLKTTANLLRLHIKRLKAIRQQRTLSWRENKLLDTFRTQLGIVIKEAREAHIGVKNGIS